MTQALDDELITRNPCRIKKGAKSKVKREPEVLTLAELLALADAMPDQHRALTLLCGLGGLRFGEAVALRRRDVDLDAGTVNVSRTMVRVDGEKTTNSPKTKACLLYTSDAADERYSVDLGGRRIIKKKKQTQSSQQNQGCSKKANNREHR